MINEYNDYSKKYNRLQLINDYNYNYPISGEYQTDWRHYRVHKTKKKNKNTTNVLDTLQTSGGKDEPNIVFMRKL